MATICPYCNIEVSESLIEAEDGMTIDLAGRKLVFLDTPGHANHHGCIYDERTRGFFTGDTFGISYREFDNERGAMLRKIANKAKELQALINRDLTLKYTPRLRFELDGSVEKGDHILDVLSRLDVPADSPEAPHADEPADQP